MFPSDTAEGPSEGDGREGGGAVIVVGTGAVRGDAMTVVTIGVVVVAAVGMDVCAEGFGTVEVAPRIKPGTAVPALKSIAGETGP